MGNEKRLWVMGENGGGVGACPVNNTSTVIARSPAGKPGDAAIHLRGDKAQAPMDCFARSAGSQ